MPPPETSAVSRHLTISLLLGRTLVHPVEPLGSESTFGRKGVIVNKLGIILIVLLLLVVLIFGSVSLDNVIIVVPYLFLSLFFIVITLIPFQNIMKRSSYMDAWS